MTGTGNFIRGRLHIATMMMVSLAFKPLLPAKAVNEIKLPGHPFGVVETADQKWVFVSIMGEEGKSPGIVVFQRNSDHLELARFVPMVRTPSGLALTHDGDIMVAAAADAVVFFDTKRLETGEPLPAFQMVRRGPKAGCITAAVTPDDRVLFVSDEFKETITVINLDKIRSLGRDSAANRQHLDDPDGPESAVIGRISVGMSPVAMVFSRDSRWLYTTSEVAPPAWNWPRKLTREGAKAGDALVPEGAVIVIDVEKARTDPAHGIVARIPSGGSPVRLALAPDGSRLFVTARNSNAVYVFETAEIQRSKGEARPAIVHVGQNPVPVVLVKDGRYALVGNSNRYSADAMKSSTLSVIDSTRVGTGLDPVIASIACGAFPRNFFMSSDGHTLYLTNFQSSSLQILDTSDIGGSP